MGRPTAVLFSSTLLVGLLIGPLVADDPGTGERTSQDSSSDDIRVVFSEVDGEIEVVVDDLDDLEDDLRVIFYEVNGQVHVMLRQ